MADRSLFHSDILPILHAILRDRQSRADVQKLFRLSHALALSLIRKKIASGSLHPRYFGLRASDIAIDAIADLFREDGDGRLIQITSYFESIDWEKASEQELVVLLRRLVFSRTNHGLFRMYNEIDPGLGKILRNIKLSIASLENFVEVDHLGETCIVPAMCDPESRLPMLSREGLDPLLLHIANGEDHIPEILAKLSRYLRGQTEYSRMVPIAWIALSIRNLYRQTDQIVDDNSPPDQELIANDLFKLVREACNKVSRENEHFYLSRKKIPREIYCCYIAVIEEILVKRLISNDGHNVSLFKSLRLAIPELKKETFDADHRSTLEYLARLAEKEAIRLFRKDMQIPP